MSGENVRSALHMLRVCAVVALSVFISTAAYAGQNEKWAAAWTSAMNGAYSPLPAPLALDNQPDLSFALPKAASDGAASQTFRAIVKPDIWGDKVRIRFSNLYGEKAVCFSGVTVGLQEHGANVVPGTITRVTFNGGSAGLSMKPGERVFSDPIQLKFVQPASKQLLEGRNLAISYAVNESTGPMTYHHFALTTSYISPPGFGDHSRDESDTAFPYTTTSWFFVDAVDVQVSHDVAVVVVVGDSITDGVFSTVNGNDRWSNFLSGRLHRAHKDRISVVNQAIAGNRVTPENPARTSVSDDASTPIANAPLVDRLERDVLDVSGVTAVVLLEGINDLGSEVRPESIIEAYKELVRRLHSARIKVIGCTIVSSYKPKEEMINFDRPADAGFIISKESDAWRRRVNTFIKTSGLFDSVADMDAATLDIESGALRAEYIPNSTVVGTPLRDFIHPNRAGLQAMAQAIDISALGP